ncbi:biliverdin-producing heme oxygenase [Sphingomonas sp. CA1-15]|uniref:Biliverdin-producing heme oxygenase n=1 Tax=Sphingomonas immobilis TaxID=3063997 RepID=A0ABT9A116_9SPHN|nr:biliverdin-producing heme oxygenase [Sphingomonas sp. CA1-15]
MDAAFAGYDLATPDGYRGFLLAHARVLPGVEAALAPTALIAGWVGRTDALLADLDALAAPVPPVSPVVLPSGEGARWGAFYVLEGSRLGGAFLARQVAAGFPKAYLEAVHAPGRWQHILAALDRAAGGPDWIADAVAGAKAVFAAYGHAAGETRPGA